MLTIRNEENGIEASFTCHADEILAATHGLTFQAGNANGHVLISTEKDSICLSFGIAKDGHKSCLIPTKEFEESLMRLKAELR